MTCPWVISQNSHYIIDRVSCGALISDIQIVGVNSLSIVKVWTRKNKNHQGLFNSLVLGINESIQSSIYAYSFLPFVSHLQDTTLCSIYVHSQFQWFPIVRMSSQVLSKLIQLLIIGTPFLFPFISHHQDAILGSI